jgi:hypothetical protein
MVYESAWTRMAEMLGLLSEDGSPDIGSCKRKVDINWEPGNKIHGDPGNGGRNNNKQLDNKRRWQGKGRR